MLLGDERFKSGEALNYIGYNFYATVVKIPFNCQYNQFIKSDIKNFRIAGDKEWLAFILHLHADLKLTA